MKRSSLSHFTLLVFWAVAVPLLQGCTRKTPEETVAVAQPQDRPTEENHKREIKIGEPLFTVYVVIPRTNQQPILFGIWPDGKFICRERFSGVQAREGTVSKVELDQFVDRVQRTGFFDYPSKWRRRWEGYDASHHEIRAYLSGVSYDFASWHEFFEEDKRLVVLDGGVQSLGGQNRLKAIERSSEQWKMFRMVWSQLMQAVAEFCACHGTNIVQ